jgi:hypothetical protein
MSKRVIAYSEDEDEEQVSESPPQKRTRVVRKPSQRQVEISTWPLNKLSSNIHIQFTDKENEETEQNKIARMEKEILKLRRKNKKAAEGILLVHHRFFFWN